MPLHSEQHIGQHTQILIWEITEAFEDLFDEVALTDFNMVRLMSMKSEQHQRGFLSVRKLLGAAGYSDFDLFYDETGKPHLKDGRHISISHSHGYSAIILSDTVAGIDLELVRDKIIRIADKFTSDSEEIYLNPVNEEYVSQLTVIWGVKEAIFKIRNEVGISFKDHISVAGFTMNDESTTAKLDFENTHRHFDIRFCKIKNYILVYAFETRNEPAL
jgi:phosphopantetheinyl transferase